LLGVGLAWPQKLDSNWIALFNGRDFSNWYSYIAPPTGAAKRFADPAADPDKNFRVVNGEIVHAASATVNQTMGYLGTDSAYSRYQFRVEYKFGPTCAKGVSYCRNSGLLYHMIKDGIFGEGIECNMYWDWPTAIAGLGGVTFDKARPGFGNFEAEADKMNQYTNDGEWNVMEIRVWGDSAAEHYVNGHLGGWVVGIKQSDGRPLKKGAVALQIEGNDVSFRNPRIRDLDRRVDTLGCMDKKAPNYNPKATKDDGTCNVTRDVEHPPHVDPSWFQAGMLQSGRLTLKGGETHVVEIMDVNGRVVFSRSIPQPMSIDFRDLLPDGLYFVRIRSGGGPEPRGFTLQKMALLPE